MTKTVKRKQVKDGRTLTVGLDRIAFSGDAAFLRGVIKHAASRNGDLVITAEGCVPLCRLVELGVAVHVEFPEDKRRCT